MLSFSKILLLVVVIGAVWFGWRWFARMTADGRLQGRAPQGRQRRQPADRKPSGAARSSEAEDMEKCGDCGAYVAPRAASACGRAGCPYGR